jgi:septal ring factor EnvC (AmiA/AmiB activator)
VPAGITIEELRPGLDSELTATRRRPAQGHDRGHDLLIGRRRPGEVHRILACVLAVLALVGCVVAILLLAVAPTAARLRGDVTALDGRLSSTQSQLAALQAMTAHTAMQGSHLTRRVHRVTQRIAGLSRTVHGLQGSSTLVREQSDGLRACFAELQQELSGLAVTTRSVRGRVRSVGLTERDGLSPACSAAFSRG